MDMNLSKIQETVEDTGAWHATIHEVAKSRHNLVTKQQKQHRLSLWLNSKESACQRRSNKFNPTRGLQRSSGEGNDNPLQYSCLGHPMEKGVWLVTVHWVAESDMT